MTITTVRSQRREAARRVVVVLATVCMLVATFGVQAGDMAPAGAATVTTPGPVHLGDIVQGQLAVPGAQDQYSLLVTAPGARAAFTVSDDACGCAWSLASHSGSVFTTSSLSNEGPFWLAPGAYVFTIVDGAPGTYSFRLWSVPDPQSFAINIGLAVSSGVPSAGAGKIESPGAQDRYTFSVATGGARLYVQSITNLCGCVWSLRSSSGSYEHGFAQQAMGDVATAFYPAGSYVLTVGAPGTVTGTYKFEIWNVASPTTYAVSVGQTVSNGVPSAGAGNVESPGAQDRYSFSVGAGGARLYLQVVSNACGCLWSLRSSSGSYEHGFTHQSIGDVPAAFYPQGTYVITVSGSGATIGTYSFTVRNVPAVQAFAISVGQSVSNGVPSAGAGNIESAGSQDQYTFSVGMAGARLYLQSTNACSCLWSLRSSSGSYEHGFAQQSMGDVDTAFYPQGTYVLTVTGSGATTGTYGFKLSSVANAQTFAISVGQSVSNGVPSAGAGNIESPGVQDRYTFSVGAGGARLYFQVTSNGCGCRWSARSSSGSYEHGFAQQVLSDVGTAFYTQGAYVVTVDASGANTGTYAFKVWSVPDPQSFAISLGQTVSNGVPSAGAGNIESPGAQDRYSFSAGAGTRVAISSPACNVSATYVLSAPSGWQITTQNTCASAVVLDLPNETGQYGIEVTSSAGSTGTYSLQVATSAATPNVTVPPHQVFPISVGDSVSDGVPSAGAGNIETNGTVDEYVFNANAGDVVRLEDTSAQSCCSLFWEMFAPDGDLLGSQYWGNFGTGQTFTAAESGTYNLVAFGSGSSTGTYAFTLASVPAHDVFAISVGSSVSNGVPAAGAGNIEQQSSVDEYAFSANAGDVVRLEDTSGASCCTLMWELRAPDGSVLGGTWWGNFGTGETFALAQTGTYTLISFGNNGATGTYAFTLASVPAHDVFSIAVGDSVSDGVPSSGAGNIEQQASVDEYTFNANAGDVVRLVDSGAVSCCTLLWELRAPNGSVLGGTWWGNFGTGETFVMPQSGVYTLVSWGNNGATGTYAFSLQAEPAHQVFAISVGDSVSDGVPSAGAGNIEQTASVDEYTFSANAGDVVRLADSSAISCCTLAWDLRAPDGTVLNGAWFGNTISEEFVMPQTGTYTIVASGSNGATGTYGFSLSAVPAHDVFAITTGMLVSDGAPAPGAGNIEQPRAVDEYTFSGTAGELLQFGDPGAVACCSIQWQLLAPDGTGLGGTWFTGSSTTQTFVLAQTGTYTVVVSGNIDDTGTYSFSLAALPAHQLFPIATGTSVSNGVPSAGAGNIEGAGSVDEYVFNGSAGQVVQLIDPGSTSCCALQWQLFAPDGTLLGTDSFGDGPGGLFVLPATGLYSIVASGDGGGSGTYSFSLTAPVAQQFPITGGTAVSDGSPSSGAGNIETAGAVDSYPFDGVAGETIRLVDPGTTPCCDFAWTLFAPDGTTVAVGTLGNAGTTSEVLAQTGTYTILVAGTNSATGSYAFTFRSAPSAPVIGTFSVHGTTGSVAFGTPATNGGSSITGYHATCTSADGGTTRTGNSSTSPTTVSSLTPAHSYSCTVTASNGNGTGQSSDASNVVMVPNFPGAPTNARAVSGSTTTTTGPLTVSFTPPATNGGTAITSYSVSCTSTNGGTARSASGPASPVTVTGATTAKSYTCTVRAVNAVGAGPASVPSAAVIVGAPGAPTNVKAAPGSTTTTTGPLVVSFTAPANNGAAITGYSVTCTSTNGGVTKTATGSVSPVTVTGLTTAKTYTCAVKATNARGSGPATSAPAVIVGAPAAPTAVTAVKIASGQLKVSFTAGANNGSTITSFTATCSSSNGGVTRSQSAAAGPITVTTLTAGKLYTCVVAAANARGTGPPSAASSAVTA